MMDRFYDLNDRDACATAVIKLGGRTFRIRRVVTGVRVEYANLLLEQGKLLKETASLDSTDMAAAKTLLEKGNDFQKRKEDCYDRVLTLLLERNGETYDKAWWEANTDEYDVRAFIDTCLSKDAASVKKKTEA